MKQDMKRGPTLQELIDWIDDSNMLLRQYDEYVVGEGDDDECDEGCEPHALDGERLIFRLKAFGIHTTGGGR